LLVDGRIRIRREGHKLMDPDTDLDETVDTGVFFILGPPAFKLEEKFSITLLGTSLDVEK
jgi:hypothetical protein